MIRTPRKPHVSCSCGTCRVCTDPLSVAWAADTADRNSRWRTVDLGANARHRMVAVGSLASQVRLNEPRRVPVVPNFAGLETHFAELRRRLGGGDA